MKHKINILITDDYSTSRDVGLCLHTALAKKIQIYFLSERRFPLIRLSRFAKDVFIISDSKDINVYRDQITEIINRYNIHLIFPVSSKSISRVLRITDELSGRCLVIPLPELKSFETANNKWRLYNFLDSQKISTPVSYRFNPEFDFHRLSYPVLLKPFKGRGGKGIIKLDTFPQNRQKLSSMVNRDYIIQEYVEGYDIDCSVLCKDGNVVAHTIQKPLDSRTNFAPKVYALSFINEQNVIDMVQRVMSKLQWNGVAHVDLRYDTKNQEFCILEINPRFWTSLLASLSVGVNFPYLLFKLAHGERLPLPKDVSGHYFSLGAYLKGFFSKSKYSDISSSNLKYHIMDPFFTLAKILKWIGTLFLNRSHFRL